MEDTSKVKIINIYDVFTKRQNDITRTDIQNILQAVRQLKSKRTFDVYQQKNLIIKINDKIMTNINDGRKYSNLQNLMRSLLVMRVFDIQELLKIYGGPYQSYLLKCKDWYVDDEDTFSKHLLYLSFIKIDLKYDENFMKNHFDRLLNETIDEVERNCKFIKIPREQFVVEEEETDEDED